MTSKKDFGGRSTRGAVRSVIYIGTLFRRIEATQSRKDKNLILVRVANLSQRYLLPAPPHLPLPSAENVCLLSTPDDTKEIRSAEKLSFLRYFAKFLLVK